MGPARRHRQPPSAPEGGGTLPHTLEDAREPRDAPCAVLTYVLHYDDLLADDSASFPLDGPRPITLGRAADDADVGFRTPTELRLPDGWASGNHAQIDRRGDGDVLIDQGSRNGTRVNGRPVTEWRLEDGDLIEIGHSLLVYRRVSRSAANTVMEDESTRRLGPTVSFCPEVISLAKDLRRISPSDEPVLVLAETGTGKEEVARMIHDASGRLGDLRAVDCGAIPENLFESTFFGHKKGAFTGADETRSGEFQRADEGTLFLDEVGNLSPAAQAKLLRVVETGEVTRVGAVDAVQLDIRCVAATNRDLFLEEHGFRQDLLRRLAGYVARVPPLRDRREDLGVLTAHLLREASAERITINASAARVLFGGAFPGNIRQLRASLRSAILLSGGEPIQLEHLPEEPSGSLRPAGAPRATVGAPRTPDRAEVERALADSRGNVAASARTLGTHARQVYRWIEKYGIDLDSFRR